MNYEQTAKFHAKRLNRRENIPKKFFLGRLLFSETPGIYVKSRSYVVVEVDDYNPVLYHEIRLMQSSEDGRTSSRAAGLSSQQIQEIVDHHNQLRAGEGASNMEVLVRHTRVLHTCQPHLFRLQLEYSIYSPVRFFRGSTAYPCRVHDRGVRPSVCPSVTRW